MNKNRVLNKMSHKLRLAAPTILTCMSVVGVAATAIMAVKATPKALKLAKEEQQRQMIEKNNLSTMPLTRIEFVRATWKCYIPATLVGISTIACVLGANVLNKRNQASLASAYAMLHQSYQNYRKAANTVYGEDADIKIKAQMAKDAYISADGCSVYPLDNNATSDTILCYDYFSQRYFSSNIAAILNAEYHINRNLQLRGDVTLNEFYEFLGIDKTPSGDEMGWTVDELIEDGLLWLDFDNRNTKMDDGMECCVISTLVDPILLVD